MNAVIRKMPAMLKWLMAVPLALGLAHAHAETVLEKARAKNEIRIATSDSLKPWGYMDDTNKPIGFNLDVSREMGKRMGFGKVTFVTDSYKNFISGLNADRYDMVVAILTPTEERRKSADFSNPYMVVSKNIFVRDDNTSIRSLEDLAGKRLGVAAGTTHEAWARQHVKDAQIRVYDNFFLALQDLAIGRVDARITDRVTGMTAAKEGRFPVKIAGPDLSQDIGAIAYKKGQDDLAAIVNKVIQEMVDDGSLNEISRKWLAGIEMGEELKKLPKDAR